MYKIYLPAVIGGSKSHDVRQAVQKWNYFYLGPLKTGVMGTFERLEARTLALEGALNSSSLETIDLKKQIIKYDM